MECFIWWGWSGVVFVRWIGEGMGELVRVGGEGGEFVGWGGESWCYYCYYENEGVEIGGVVGGCVVIGCLVLVLV